MRSAADAGNTIRGFGHQGPAKWVGQSTANRLSGPRFTDIQGPSGGQRAGLCAQQSDEYHRNRNTIRALPTDPILATPSANRSCPRGPSSA